jgi:YrbI family 3-deoxy-D-manno-octulosonate 8-phosphate phosphatase
MLTRSAVEPVDPSPAVLDAIRDVRLLAFDFDGVFTDNFVYVGQHGEETVRCWRGDGLGLSAVARLGLHTVIISTEVNPVVSARARKLKIECIQGCDDKLAALDAVCTRHGLAFAQAAFVGNDVNDRRCLEAVRLPIVVHDAHPDVVPIAAYRTRIAGGYGAVREVCDLFERVLAQPRTIR